VTPTPTKPYFPEFLAEGLLQMVEVEEMELMQVGAEAQTEAQREVGQEMEIQLRDLQLPGTWREEVLQQVRLQVEEEVVIHFLPVTQMFQRLRPAVVLGEEITEEFREA
jgi:hypothetical protein